METNTIFFKFNNYKTYKINVLNVFNARTCAEIIINRYKEIIILIVNYIDG